MRDVMDETPTDQRARAHKRFVSRIGATPLAMLAWSAVAVTTFGCAHDVTPPVGRNVAAEDEQYLGLVRRELISNYKVPKSVVERGTPLKAMVVLYIEPDGRVARWRFKARSGDSEFDAAVAELAERVRLPPPPEALRERYGSAGIMLMICL
jgi:hypothetical protein